MQDRRYWTLLSHLGLSFIPSTVFPMLQWQVFKKEQGEVPNRDLLTLNVQLNPWVYFLGSLPGFWVRLSPVEGLLSTKGKLASMMISWFGPLSSVGSLSLSLPLSLSPLSLSGLCSDVFGFKYTGPCMHGEGGIFFWSYELVIGLADLSSASVMSRVLHKKHPAGQMAK